MKTVVNEELFDSMQMEMLSYIIRGVKEMLEEADLEEEQVMSITEDVAFTVSCIIDSSTVMEFEGKPLSPCLTFVTDGKGEECIISENGSWMHEYAFGMAREIFSEDESIVEEPLEVERSANFSDSLSVEVLFTYKSGVRVLYSIVGLMSEEDEINSMVNAHYEIVDPTVEVEDRSSTLKPREVSPVFEELIEATVTDGYTGAILNIAPSAIKGLHFRRIYRHIIKSCKSFKAGNS